MLLSVSVCMYYKVFWITCQPLGLVLVRSNVAFKQQTAKEQQTPGLEPSDLGQAKDRGHQPVPQ